MSDEKHVSISENKDTPWIHRRERRLSLEAVGAGVKLFNTSVNKPVSVVSRIILFVKSSRISQFYNMKSMM